MKDLNKLKVLGLVIVMGVVLGLVIVAVKSIFGVDPKSTLGVMISGGVVGGISVLLVSVLNAGLQKGLFKWLLKKKSGGTT